MGLDAFLPKSPVSLSDVKNASTKASRTVASLDAISRPYRNEGGSVPAKKILGTDLNALAQNFSSVRQLENAQNALVSIPDAKPSASVDDIDDSLGYKVRLFAVRNFPQERVIFEVSPTFSESRSIEYTQVNPVHMPGSIQVYKHTSARTFSIGAKLISRNTSQADENMRYLQLLRGWSMPYFGIRSHYDTDTNADDFAQSRISITDAGSMLGAPPDVLYLYAYSNSLGSSNDRPSSEQSAQVNIKKIPVVLTSLGIDYPEDVDYIASSSGTPFPVKMEVRIELSETHSPAGYERFSLSMFKRGQLVQF